MRISWSKDDEKKITKLNKIDSPIEAYCKEFPDRSWDSISAKLKRMGLSTPVHDVAKDVADIRDRIDQDLIMKKYKTLVKDSAFQDRLIALMQDAITALPELKFPLKIAPVKAGSKECAVVVEWSDWHAGEYVDIKEMNGLNEYNFQIMTKYVEHMTDTIIKITETNLRPAMNVQDLYVNALGDFVTGIIHEELYKTADVNLFHMVFGTALVITQSLQDLASHFRTIHVTLVPGNHGRTQKEYEFKEKYVNYDYFIFNVVAALLKNQPNIKFNLPFCFFETIDILGHLHLLMHGDNIPRMLGIPWYGVHKAMANFSDVMSSQGKYIEYVNLGHFHNKGILDKCKGEMLINGSLVGGTQFSLGKVFTTSEPKQLMYTIHEEQGLTSQWNLQFRSCKKYEPSRYIYSPEIQFVDQLKILGRAK
jgi:hypothetical protein